MMTPFDPAWPEIPMSKPTHFRLSIGWLMLSYLGGMLTVIFALWWGAL